jgi:hypothetical protein
MDINPPFPPLEKVEPNGYILYVILTTKMYLPTDRH